MKLFYFIAGKISYTFAVTLFLTFFGIIEILLSYIISATYITFSFDKIYGMFIHILPLVIIAVTFIFFIMSGFLLPLKIPALLKRYRKINNVFRLKMDVEIKDLKETYGDFSDLVMYSIASSFFYVFLIGAGMTGFCLYKYYLSAGITYPELQLVIKIILIASIISIILFGMTALILTEYLTYRERSDLYNEIVINGEIMKPYTLYSISADFIFYVFLLLIILFTFTAQFEKLKTFDKNNLLIFTYILGAIFCVLFTARIHTKSVQRVIRDVIKVTADIASGKKEGFRYISLCREFAEAQQSLMSTAREMELSRKNLELIILERTDELEKALDAARNKDDLLKKQLDIAGMIQQNVQLLTIEDWNELKFSISHKKVKKLGGDYYDFFQLSDNKIAILIADIQGNNIPASLMTAMAKVFFPAAFKKSDSPGEIFQDVNFNILSYFKSQSTIDCFIAVIDDNYHMTYSCAGNMVPVILRKDSGVMESLETDNRAIGSDEKNIALFHETDTKIEYGDRLILYTDGITLACNSAKDEYSLERLKDSITKNSDLDTDNFTSELIRDVNNYKAGTEPADDTSLIVIELYRNEPVEIIKSSKILIDNFKYPEAVELLENGLEKYPDNLQLLYHLGKNYLRVDNYNAAVQVLEKYLETDNKNKYAFYVIGACFYQMMDYKKAIENFNNAISIDPYMSPALFALGMSYKNIGDYNIAIEIFNKVSEIDTENKMSIYEIRQIEKLKNESAP